jgi:hypothetical protein
MLGGLLGLIIIMWIKAANSLSVQFNKKEEEVRLRLMLMLI